MFFTCQKLLLLLVLYSIHLFVLGQPIKEYLANNAPPIEVLIEKATFAHGTVYFEKDSLQGDLLVFRRKYKNEAYLYCVLKDQMGYFRYSAYQIEGYRIENDLFIKHKASEGSFFIHQIRKGVVDLYECDGVPGNYRFQYYLNFNQMKNLVIISPHENDINVFKAGESSNSSAITPSGIQFTSNNIDEKFKAFISIYMGDCRRLKNMIEDGLLSINNIPDVVEVYNKCK
jgi:hypothetical protein